MRVAVFSTKPYDTEFLERANQEHGHELLFHEARLGLDTARLADDADAVCAFVNDDLGAGVLEQLAASGIQLVVLRSAGFNHVDLDAAARLGVTVGRVPAYSPYAVAEHATALILTLNRKLHRAYQRVREHNFSLHGLMGFVLHGRTVGIVGTGAIGTAFARIMDGFGCRLLGYDPHPNDECRELGVRYVPLDELFAGSDIIALHCPLTAETHHLVDAGAIATMRPGVMLVNTSRGAVVDTTAVIDGLKSGRVGSLAIDVYEEEADLFFEDRSDHVIDDDVFSRLLTFPNVLITGHQGFFTEEALTSIAEATLANVSAFAQHGAVLHDVHA